MTTATVRQTMLDQLPSHASVYVSVCETTNHLGTRGEWSASICHHGPGVTLTAPNAAALITRFKAWRAVRRQLSGIAGDIGRAMEEGAAMDLDRPDRFETT